MNITSERNFTIASERNLSSSGFTFITCIYFFGVLGNAGALFYLLRHKTRPLNPRHAFLLTTLATNDLTAMVGMWIQMNIKYFNQARTDSQLSCAIRVIWRSFGLGSGCIVCIMAVERCIALHFPNFCHKRVTLAFVRKCTLILWILNLFVVCMPLFGFGVYYNGNKLRCVRYKLAKDMLDVAYAYLYFFFGVILTICLVSFNLLVVWILISRRRSKTKRLRYDKDAQISQNQQMGTFTTSKDERTFACIMGVLCSAFTVCWIPQLASIPLALNYPETPKMKFYIKVADGLMAFHFVLNPYLYILMRRSHLFHPFKWCRKPSSNSYSMETTNELFSVSRD